MGVEIMHYDIQSIQIEEEFKICPTCGYRDGFHSMLKKEHLEIKIYFICPGCHDVFDADISFSINADSL